jgi:hypothetical protein
LSPEKKKFENRKIGIEAWINNIDSGDTASQGERVGVGTRGERRAGFYRIQRKNRSFSSNTALSAMYRTMKRGTCSVIN